MAPGPTAPAGRASGVESVSRKALDVNRAIAPFPSARLSAVLHCCRRTVGAILAIRRRQYSPDRGIAGYHGRAVRARMAATGVAHHKGYDNHALRRLRREVLRLVAASAVNGCDHCNPAGHGASKG